MIRKLLLFCGILSSVVYFGMNVFIPMYYEGYDSISQTVSELSAIDTPTRPLWMFWIIIDNLLLVAFGTGLWLSKAQHKYLRIIGILFILHAIFGLFWPPMHTREVLAAGGGTTSDILHIVWTAITVPLFLLEVGFGAAVFGKGFRLYSIGTILVIVLFGILTGLDSSEMEANLPTPLMGLWERINIAAYMIWVIVFAIKTIRMVNGPR